MMMRMLIALSAGITALSAPLAAQQIGLPQREASGASRAEGKFVALGGRLGQLRIACSQCHGMDGLGDASGAFPRLDAQSPWYLYKSLQDYASGLRYSEVMTPVALQLDDRAMQDVSAYYASRTPDWPIVPAGADAGTLQRGGVISAVGIPERGVAACQNCHGPEGRGMPPVYPVLAGQYAPYIEVQLRRWRDGQRKGDPLGVMREVASQMSEEDIRAVSVYFAAVGRDAAAPSPQRQPGAIPAGSAPAGEDEVP